MLVILLMKLHFDAKSFAIIMPLGFNNRMHSAGEAEVAREQ